MDDFKSVHMDGLRRYPQHETRIDQSGQSCVLVYDAIASEPREMLIARHMVLRLFVLRLGYVSYIHWKTPVPE
ncbi:hypothetical protein BB934_43795 (plasmid) [Microvirga ossetica]|uniref:Uncharacterized protein n=1 Tax=Microvirga ossetica TaxID=1882682 RepID=A0A1B2EYR0_9HYPH|nr:hypothetical protein [Microvirga ossetica]ANY85125.1 hypothetical protein BB934_43795 [Microvirga ossetica]